MPKLESKSPHKNQACLFRIGCNGIYPILYVRLLYAVHNVLYTYVHNTYLAQKPDLSASIVTGSGLMPRFRLFLGQCRTPGGHLVMNPGLERVEQAPK